MPEELKTRPLELASRQHASEQFCALLSVISGTPEEPSLDPVVVERELSSLSTIVKYSKDVSALVDTALESCVTIVNRPPSDNGPIEGLLSPFQQLQTHIQRIRNPQGYTVLDTLMKSVQQAREISPEQAVYKTQVILASFASLMEQFGHRAPSLSENHSMLLAPQYLIHSHMLHTLSGEQLQHVHPDIGLHATAHLVETTQLKVPHPKLENEATQIATTVSFTDQEQAVISEVTYRVSVVIQDPQTDQWRTVSMNPAVPSDEYKPDTHIPSQMLGIWTHDLPHDRCRYAVVVEATPWFLGTIEDVPDSTETFLSFQAPTEEQREEKEYEFMRILRSLPDTHIGMFQRVYDTTQTVAITSDQARNLLEQLEAAHSPALDWNLSLQESKYVKKQGCSLSFCTRVGTQNNPGQLVPLMVSVDATGTRVSELMDSPETLSDYQASVEAGGPNAEDHLAIVNTLDTPDKSGMTYAVFSAAHTHVTSETGERALGSYQPTQMTSRDMYIEPMNRAETMAQGVEWSGNLIQVIPTIIATSQQMQVSSEPQTHTLREILTRISEQKTRLFEWKCPVLSDEVEKQYLGFRAFGDQVINILNSDPRFTKRGRFTGATTQFGQARNLGTSQVRTVSAIAQLSPIDIRLVLQEHPAALETIMTS